MLVLRRRPGEAINIGDDIIITVLTSDDGGAKLAIEAPKSITILRSELVVAMDVNKDAAKESGKPQDLLTLLGGMKVQPTDKK